MDTARFARLAGGIGLLGGLVGAGFAATELVSPSDVSLAGSLRNSLFHLAAIVGLVGLALLRAAGSTWTARVGVGAAMAGFALLVAAELTDPFDSGTSETLFSISPLIIGVGMLVTGVAVLRERRWTGWRRFAPVVCGAYVFVIFLPLVITLGDPGLWATLAVWELCFAALGLAVVVEASATMGTRYVGVR